MLLSFISKSQVFWSKSAEDKNQPLLARQNNTHKTTNHNQQAETKGPGLQEYNQ